MTVYLHDLSNHDWDRHPVNLANERAAGIAGVTHKVSEGHPGGYVDPYAAQFFAQAAAAGFPVIGGYHVLYPGDPEGQADFYLAQLVRAWPDWMQYPCFVHQIDDENFGGVASTADVQRFGNRIKARTGCTDDSILSYSPAWMVGDARRGLTFRLWASNYGPNPVAGYRTAYPGDGSSRWAAYSGQTPLVLQYGSQTIIGNQPTCDANAVRVKDEAALVALFNTSEDWLMVMTPAQAEAMMRKVYREEIAASNKFWLPRLLFTLRKGAGNRAFSASGAGGSAATPVEVLDGKGIDGEIAGVSATVDTAALAAQIAAALPADQARQVVDQLVAILNKGVQQ